MTLDEWADDIVAQMPLLTKAQEDIIALAWSAPAEDVEGQPNIVLGERPALEAG